MTHGHCRTDAEPTILTGMSPLRHADGADGGAPPDALLDAAFRVFAERGYRATRLDDVAAAVGVTKGAIYYYFEGKEDLLRQAVQSRHRAIFAEIEHAPGMDGAPAAARIRVALRRIWEHWREPGWGHAVRLMLGEVNTEFPALFRIWADEGPIRGWSLLRDLVEEGQRQGEFRRDVDADVAARVMVSGLMLQAALHLHLGLADRAPCDPERLFESAVEHFLHGLKAHPAPASASGPPPSPSPP